MGSMAIALIVFACVFGGAMVGMGIGAVLPRHHLAGESKDVVKLAMAMIATMSALVLGLLTSSAKTHFDATSTELQQSAATILSLDRTLADYGPDAQPIRAAVKQGLALRLETTWPTDGTRPAAVDTSDTNATILRIEEVIRSLTPTTDDQRALKARALEQAGEVLHARWLVLSSGAAIPTPLLVVVVFWLATIFGSFGLFAPRNATVVGALFMCALSVSGALFLILELDTPLEGLLKVSPAPLRFALSRLGQ